MLSFDQHYHDFSTLAVSRNKLDLVYISLYHTVSKLEIQKLKFLKRTPKNKSFNNLKVTRTLNFLKYTAYLHVFNPSLRKRVREGVRNGERDWGWEGKSEGEEQR